MKRTIAIIAAILTIAFVAWIGHDAPGEADYFKRVAATGSDQ